MIRKKHLLIFLSLFCSFFISSCGHNALTTSKGIGVDLSWTGSNYIPNVRVGYWDVVSAVPRGNASVSTTTATGGVLGNGGTSQTTVLVAGVQLNEGNIVQICTSPNSSDKTKIAALKAITQLTPPMHLDNTAKTISAAAAVGPNSNQIRPVTTGTDKIIETIGDNADKIADVSKSTINTVGDVSKTTVTTTGNAATSTVDAIKQLWLKVISSTKSIIIFAILIIAIILLIVLLLFFRFYKKKKSNQENTIIQQDSNLETTNTNKQSTVIVQSTEEKII